MRASIALISVMLAMAGCNRPASSSPEDARATPAASALPMASASAPAAAQPVGGARSVKIDNALYQFDYSYPAAAGAIPALRQQLDAELKKQRGELIAEANEAKAGAARDGFDYNPNSRYTEWKVVTETPGWLSLSSLVSAFTGGAHPNYWFAAILWDKAANRQREAAELFTSKADLTRAIQPEFCRQIDHERAKRRGEPVKRASGEEYDKCLDPASYVLILGSSNGKAFNRIGILVPPYEAGPYVEGSYEATLPVTLAILAEVKPEFRAAFVAAR